MSNIPFKNIPHRKSSDERDLDDLLADLKQAIPAFTQSSIFARDIFPGSDENHFTETLLKYLQNEKPQSRFSFMNQASLPNRRSIDISVYLKANSEHYIFCIEAKFLPPTDYVDGEYAAIKRFKKREHGVSNRNPEKAKPLAQSAIVGYSKLGGFNEHLDKINNKILSLSSVHRADEFGLLWEVSEQLQKISWKADCVFLRSKHLCIDDTMIHLHHFWIKI